MDGGFVVACSKQMETKMAIKTNFKTDNKRQYEFIDRNEVNFAKCIVFRRIISIFNLFICRLTMSVSTMPAQRRTDVSMVIKNRLISINSHPKTEHHSCSNMCNAASFPTENIYELTSHSDSIRGSQTKTPSIIFLVLHASILCASINVRFVYHRIYVRRGERMKSPIDTRQNKLVLKLEHKILNMKSCAELIKETILFLAECAKVYVCMRVYVWTRVRL